MIYTYHTEGYLVCIRTLSETISDNTLLYLDTVKVQSFNLRRKRSSIEPSIGLERVTIKYKRCTPKQHKIRSIMSCPTIKFNEKRG